MRLCFLKRWVSNNLNLDQSTELFGYCRSLFRMASKLECSKLECSELKFTKNKRITSRTWVACRSSQGLQSEKLTIRPESRSHRASCSKHYPLTTCKKLRVPYACGGTLNMIFQTFLAKAIKWIRFQQHFSLIYTSGTINSNCSHSNNDT